MLRPTHGLCLLVTLVIALQAHGAGAADLPERVTVRIGARLQLDEVRVSLPGGTIRVLGRDLRDELELPPASTVELVPGDDRVYVGSLVVEQGGEGTVAHLTLDRDDYLAGVVVSEMGGEAPGAALGAQAVASRSLLTRGDRHPGDPWTLCDLTHCQSFRGITDLDAARRAVEDTADRVLVDGGLPVEAPFHSTCGGRTLASARIWGTVAPHLPGVSDLRPDGTAYCDHSPHGAWTAAVMSTDLPDPEQEPDLFRLAVGRLHGWNVVKSNDFVARLLPWKGGGVWWLEGTGLGHGVGLCQQGAIGRALAGQGLDEILGAYFPGTEAAPP